MTTFSFEVFPPKTDDGLEQLATAVAELEQLGPSFVSITYGAGGSSRDRSFETIATVARHGSTMAAHLTCVGQSRAELHDVIDRYLALGVEHVVALRGDPPEGIDAPYQPHDDGYASTAELVAAAKARGIAHVSVSGYPEKHPQSPSADHDMAILAEKAAAGADRAITQMCFDTDATLRWIDRVRATGLDIDIAPGIFPIHSFPAVARFAERCGASMPAVVVERFAGLDDDPDTTAKVGAEFAAQQIARLRQHGVDHVHIYTLNRASLARAVHEQL